MTVLMTMARSQSWSKFFLDVLGLSNLRPSPKVLQNLRKGGKNVEEKNRMASYNRLFSPILRQQAQQNFRNLDSGKILSFHGGNLQIPLSLERKIQNWSSDNSDPLVQIISSVQIAFSLTKTSEKSLGCRLNDLSLPILEFIDKRVSGGGIFLK